MTPFKTIREDGKSYREIVVELVAGREPETLVPYEELAGALDMDVVHDLSRIQAAANQANKTLLKRHNLGVRNVKKLGYRVLRANEHMVVAAVHENKADKAIGRALALYDHTDLGDLTEGERKMHEGLHMVARAVAASHKHLSRRIDKIEDLLRGKPTVQG